MKNLKNLIDAFFADCRKEGLPPDSNGLRAWLWFTCPAQLRSEVGHAIAHDQRYASPQAR